MPYKVRCRCCDMTDVVRDPDEWHGSHPVDVLREASDLEHAKAKRSKKGNHESGRIDTSPGYTGQECIVGGCDEHVRDLAAHIREEHGQ